jgi:proline iminopeptidase
MRRLDALAEEFELIYYDARGSGQTELGDTPELTFARAVADLEGLRAGLGIERCSVLGHSLGGHVAFLYAARYPERVEALLLVDVGPPFAEDEASELGSAMTSSRTPEDDARLEEIQGSDAFQRREPEAVEDYILNIYAPFFRDRRSIETVELGFTPITAANALPSISGVHCGSIRSGRPPGKCPVSAVLPKSRSLKCPDRISVQFEHE